MIRPYAEYSHQADITNPHAVTYTQAGAASSDHNHDATYMALIDAMANSSPGYLVMTPTNDVTPYRSLIEVDNINIDLPSSGEFRVNGVEHTHGILYDNNTGYPALEAKCYSEYEEKYVTVFVGSPDISINAAGSSTDISIDIVPKGTGSLQYSGVEILTVAGTAADSYLLEGASAAEFATADHIHATYTAFSTGDSAPGTAPASVGLIFIDMTNKHVYMSAGTGASSDWILCG